MRNSAVIGKVAARFAFIALSASCGGSQAANGGDDAGLAGNNDALTANDAGGGAGAPLVDVGLTDATDASDESAMATRDVVNEVDACSQLFQRCTIDSQCCSPNRCLNITGESQCQQEGPALLDGGP
jgi:hypothetical protein